MKYITPKNRAILREMVATDFKVRYQGSALGYAWSLLKPLLLFAVLYILFTYIAPIGKGVEHYGVSLLIGIVLWNFFAETTAMGAGSIVANGSLLRKVSIPRYLVVLASSISALINLGLSLVIVVVFALINGVIPQWSWLLLLPIVLELFIFGIGVAFFLATANVKFRDVSYIWEVMLQIGFYASMIIIPMSIVPQAYHKWFLLNPIVQIVQDARQVFLHPTHGITVWNTIESTFTQLVPLLCIALITIVGLLYFRSRSRYFAEDI